MNSRRRWVVILCWLTVVFEGFDIVAFGAAIPTLLDTGYAGMTSAGATYISTISLVGVGLGAALIGPISDRFGRRVPLIVCVIVFSVFTLLLPLVPNVAMMGVLRLLAGLGMGACMPVAITAMQEAAPANAKANSSTITMTGYHVGAVLASLLAIALGGNWQWLFYGGGLLGLLAAAVMWAKLPETGEAARSVAGGRPERVPVSTLLRGSYLRVTLGLWVAAFMGLLLVYGLNTWLPQIMRGAGYNVADALTLLLIMNLGAVIGLLVGGRIADARGPKGTTMVWFGCAAVLLALLSIRLENALVLNAVVLVTGVFVFCAQVLLYGFVGYLYPSRLVGTGMGFVAGVGRLGAIVGPWATGSLVTAGIAYPFGFYLFAAAAVLGVVAVAVIPRPSRASAESTAESAEAVPPGRPAAG
ncbi:4-hydroxybenzoate transporter PcaK [Arthrobacter saudimassiliensis]|uniref:4-hydroxybenzoate transporter PcaK n=1 Tax=Arthrobacter saudimassiliensis TaxID=1461584 RepID=A0A078MRC2_9MICC|nr:4-hydroxybenzoate transporter PcaK [Arthrobacter saudimassiliensis]